MVPTQRDFSRHLLYQIALTEQEIKNVYDSIDDDAQQVEAIEILNMRKKRLTDDYLKSLRNELTIGHDNS